MVSWAASLTPGRTIAVHADVGHCFIADKFLFPALEQCICIIEQNISPIYLVSTDVELEPARVYSAVTWQLKC